MDLTADLKLLYAAWPAEDVQWIPVSGTGSTKRAIHSMPSIAVHGGEAYTTEHTLRYPATSFVGAKEGDQFVIAGVTYKATDAPLTTEDGMEMVVPMARTGT
jgi:hypothetical protein